MKLIKLLRYFPQTQFYGYIDNWHSHPIVSKIMCKLGRHDYEYMTTFWKANGRGGSSIAGAILACFYCGHQKKSTGSV